MSAGPCTSCGHRAADHSAEPALDGRPGCRAAIGIARCLCPAHVDAAASGEPAAAS